MRLRLPLVAVLIVAAVSLGACGSGSSGSDGGGATTEAPSSGGTSGSKGSEVTIADFAFDPSDLQAKVGDTVTFTNSDDADHTATANEDDPKVFDTGKIPGGGSKGITFDEAGDYAYYCSIHEYMKGTIHVVE